MKCNCHYPVGFQGMVETVSGMEEMYYFTCSCIRSNIDVEIVEQATQLGYQVAKFRFNVDASLHLTMDYFVHVNAFQPVRS